MMNLGSLFNIKSKTWWASAAFYTMVAVLVAIAACYFLFLLKLYLQNQRLTELDQRVSAFGNDQQRAAEQQVFDYKKEIDDFSKLLDNHRITSQVFSFIEERTLPQVWFSNFDMTQSSGALRLVGEAENMNALINQIAVFEQSKDYIRGVSAPTFQATNTGKLQFTLNFTLDPKIFTYQPVTVLPSPSSPPAIPPPGGSTVSSSNSAGNSPAQ